MGIMSKPSLWKTWKNLKSLTSLGRRKLRGCFFLRIHSIEGLPPFFDDASIVVHWNRLNGDLVSTTPFRVHKGVVDFGGAQLSHPCSVYYTRSDSHSSIKFKEKQFILYASIPDATELDLGKHCLDLTRLLPLSWDELSSGEWLTSFKLNGKARGATMHITFGYVITTHNHTPLSEVEVPTPPLSEQHDEHKKQNLKPYEEAPVAAVDLDNMGLNSFECETNSISNDFLKMLASEEDDALGLIQQPESPRERLLREFEEDQLVNNGGGFLNFEINYDLEEDHARKVVPKEPEAVIHKNRIEMTTSELQQEQIMPLPSPGAAQSCDMTETLATGAMSNSTGKEEESKCAKQGLKMKPNLMSSSSTNRQWAGSRWLLANGMGKKDKHPLLRTKTFAMLSAY